jgi:hypothetical protein
MAFAYFHLLVWKKPPGTREILPRVIGGGGSRAVT